jgi:hypothetical protein
MTNNTVALVRQAILTVLDEANPRTPGLAWDFNDDEHRVDFADRVVSFIPSAGGAIERCPKCNGDQRGAPCAYPEACGHPCRTYIAERNQALLAAASAGRDRELAEGVLKLTKTVRYLVGIAEVGEGRPMLDDETAEQFVLRYVQRLEQELKALQSHEQPIDIEERIRWHKSEARRLTLESIRGGQPSDIGEQV